MNESFHEHAISTSPVLIDIQALSKHYDKFVAVRDLSFTVRAGEVLGLVGPNGAGKTTTLRCISGIIPPTSGTVALAGYDLKSNAISAKAALAFFFGRTPFV